METRAPHIIVGIFVLTLIFAGIAFGVWVANVDIDADYKEYDIFMEGSVLGLYEQGTVFYLGIPVGKVKRIALAPDDPRKVLVTVKIKAEVPVNQGSRAMLEWQALTNVTNVQIFGGAPDAPPLETLPGQARPVIEAEISGLQEVFAQTPNLVNELLLAAGRIKQLFNEENRDQVAKILINTEQATANLAGATAGMDALVADANSTIVSIGTAADKIANLADSGTELLSEDGKLVMADISATLQTAEQAFARINALVAANEGAVSSFANGTLVEVSRLVMDLRLASQSLNRLLNRVEDNPIELLQGKTVPEYKPASNE